MKAIGEADYFVLLIGPRVGGWFSCKLASSSGMNVHWRTFPTREEAVNSFRQETQAFFQREGKLTKEREATRRKIMGILAPNNLFGFEEPAPA